jgi:uncharacterized protein (DUF1778 family)
VVFASSQALLQRRRRKYLAPFWRHKYTGRICPNKVEMMKTAIAKQDRIGARVPHEVYETLCRAAELSGATVNQFLVQAALKEAQAVIEREEVIRLSPRDWNWLLDLMENPPKPNAKLTAAMKRYQKAKRDDAGTAFNWEP